MSYYRQGPSHPRGPGGVGLSIPRLTPAIKKIIIACAAIWLLQLLLSGQPITLPGGRTYSVMSGLFGNIPGYSLGYGFLWQIVTYAFLHAPSSPMHILFNMLFLWMFGSELEQHWGQRAFFRFYLTCAAGAGVFATIINFMLAERWAPTVGASGAVYGVLVAFGIIFAERTVFFIIFPMKARTLAILLVGIQFFYTVFASGMGVSHVSHLGGALVGFLYLQRRWRLHRLVQDVRWRWMRRRFKVIQKDDDWLH